MLKRATHPYPVAGVVLRSTSFRTSFAPPAQCTVCFGEYLFMFRVWAERSATISSDVCCQAHTQRCVELLYLSLASTFPTPGWVPVLGPQWTV